MKNYIFALLFVVALVSSAAHAQTDRQLESFKKEFHNGYNRIFSAVNTYGPDQYLRLMDSIRREGDALYDRFVAADSLSEEAGAHAKAYIDLSYANMPGEYLMENSRLEKAKIPEAFYERMFAPLPLNESMLAASPLDTYVNRIHFQYVRPRVMEWFLENEDVEKLNAMTTEDIYARDPFFMRYDSLYARKLVEFTPDDPLLRQLVLAEKVEQSLNSGTAGLIHYENNRDFIEQTLTLPSLREPLEKLYAETKERLENIPEYTEAVMKQLEGTSFEELMKTMLTENKGKVIYIDVWATWCGPCKEEMPDAKKLREELVGEDVVFVYFCIESDDAGWKSDMARFEIAGQNYLLTEAQSAPLRSAFGIEGIPYYLLVDRQGRVVEQGSHLRPSHPETRTKIEKLLNE